MGYEVLDSDGASTSLSGGPHAPSDVVSFDDLPAPPDDGRDRPGRPPRNPRGSMRMPAFLGAGSRRTYIAIAVVAVAGLALGSLWTKHHAEQVQVAQQRSTVTAFALNMSVYPLVTGQGWVADYTVRVFNVGVAPLEIAVSPSTARPSTNAPLISMLSGDGTIAPGQDALVRARLPLDCTSDWVLKLAIPARAPDGSLHELALRDSDQGGLDSTGQQLCQFRPGMNSIDAELSGTIDEPMLELRNNSELTFVVTLDSGSPLTQSTSDLLSLTTMPALPVTVLPDTTSRLWLRIDVHGCERDLSQLASSGWYGYLGLQAESVNQSLTTNAGVDVSPLIGAAMVRACS